jgi:hypothetical protein
MPTRAGERSGCANAPAVDAARDLFAAPTELTSYRPQQSIGRALGPGSVRHVEAERLPEAADGHRALERRPADGDRTVVYLEQQKIAVILKAEDMTDLETWMEGPSSWASSPLPLRTRSMRRTPARARSVPPSRVLATSSPESAGDVRVNLRDP